MKGEMFSDYGRYERPRDPIYRIEHKLDYLIEQQHLMLQRLTIIVHKENSMATDLSALTAAVAHDTEVDASAITLLNQLSQMLKDAATDPAAVQAIADALAANAQALADAVVANTPAA